MKDKLHIPSSYNIFDKLTEDEKKALYYWFNDNMDWKSVIIDNKIGLKRNVYRLKDSILSKLKVNNDRELLKKMFFCMMKDLNRLDKVTIDNYNTSDDYSLLNYVL